MDCIAFTSIAHTRFFEAQAGLVEVRLDCEDLMKTIFPVHFWPLFAIAQDSRALVVHFRK
jgi:hypothetical protein